MTRLITTRSLIAYVQFLIRTDVTKNEQISQAKAFQRFGRSTVERWVQIGKVKRYFVGSKSVKFYLRDLLEAASEN